MLRSLICIFLLLLPLSSNAATGTAYPITYTGLHWTVSNLNVSNCAQLTDIYVDATGAATSGIFSVNGYASCNTASGVMAALLTGTATAINLPAGTGVGFSLYMEDYRLFCILSWTTLSSTACQLYRIADGTLINTFGMSYVP